MSEDHEPPWAMQLAVRAEKAAPPAHGAVCEAAAMAVARLLADPRATGGEWHEPVRHWEAGPIRKVTRRARGVRWPAVQNLPGITVEHAGAQVRAFVPGPVTEVPVELARLQVAGLELDDAEEPTPRPEPPYAAIALNPEWAMSTGKAAAQSGHAAHLLLREGGEPARGAWLAAGLAVHLERDMRWEDCVGHADVAVRDAGFTEVPPGTMTALAWIVST
jgi:peptidyl-tRNA hydrolase